MGKFTVVIEWTEYAAQAIKAIAGSLRHLSTNWPHQPVSVSKEKPSGHNPEASISEQHTGTNG